MGRKTPIAMGAVVVLLLGFGAAGLVHSVLQDSAASKTVVLPPAPNIVASNSVRQSEPAVQSEAQAAIPENNQDIIAQQLESTNAGDRQKALEYIDNLATSDPRSLSQGLPSWIGPLIDAKEYWNVEQWTHRAIPARDSNLQIVEAAQRGRVLAFMGEGNYAEALKEGKSYYNVVSLSGTADAIALLSQILRKTDPSAAARFQAEQIGGTEGAGPNKAQAAGVSASNSDSPPQPAGGQASVLASIKVDTTLYDKSIASLVKKQNTKGQHSYNRIARGNLLLLSDRPAEAKAAFIEAAGMAVGEKNIRDAIEGVARAMRAQDGNVARANAFILSLQQDPSIEGAKLVTHAEAAPTLEDFQAAAQKTTIAEVQMAALPPLEIMRQQREEAGADSESQIQFTSGFECSTPIDVKKLSPTHFEVSINTPFTDWFMFHVAGVAGRTVRIDLTGKNIEWNKWLTLNPMYSYVNSLDDPNSFATTENKGQPVAAWNGPLLPDTSGQKWHYIASVWRERPDALSIVQHFDSDTAYVSMRVPYTPSFNEKCLRSLSSNSVAQVVEIGRSTEGRPLLLVKIGIGGDVAERSKPCVLVYAREHADEPDSSWVAQGVIEHLLGNGPEAMTLRERFTFLVIPLLDPDTATQGRHEGMLCSFLFTTATVESMAYAKWFGGWVDLGKRLDLVINLHNVQSSESPHFACALCEGLGEPGRFSLALHSLVVKNIESRGYNMTHRPWQFGWSPDRLDGWLGHRFGPLPLAYEVNSQAPERHLMLPELKNIGTVLVDSIAAFLSSTNGERALTDISDVRSREMAGRALGDPPFSIDDMAFEERSVGASANSQASEKWIP
jgi:hypothetical protein